MFIHVHTCTLWKVKYIPPRLLPVKCHCVARDENGTTTAVKLARQHTVRLCMYICFHYYCNMFAHDWDRLIAKADVSYGE